MKCELLAPAGNFVALKAAVEAGADAVYLAGTSFGARAFAGNFSDDELSAAVRFAHLRGVAVHVAVNTLIFDDELKKLAEYLEFLSGINVDAVLLQDLGAAKIAREVAPKLTLHASTQMTAHNLDGVEALAEAGFSRVVLAREMTIEEIEKITAKSSVEIEIFVHGALCVCYSGQCYMSSQIFGRSANRGRCAQPCRLPYELTDEKGRDLTQGAAGKYLLSPRDLNTLDILPRLLKSGVASLKIEGRMKRPEYVATVTRVYRGAIDRIYADGEDFYRIEKSAANALAQVFNRDFTHAYLEEEATAKERGRRAMMSDLRPNNRGLLVGRTVGFDRKGKRATIKIVADTALSVGDEVEFWVKVGGRVTAKIDALTDADGKSVQTAAGGDTVSFAVVGTVNTGDRVFKVFDAELMKKAHRFFGEKAERRIGVAVDVRAALNEPLQLTFTDTDGNTVCVATEFAAEKARKHPLDFETARKQIERLGTSIFEPTDFSAQIDDGIMMPVSELNDVRRRAVAALESARLEKYAAKKKLRGAEKHTAAPQEKNIVPTDDDSANVTFVVAVNNIAMLQAAIDGGADAVLFGGDAPKNEPLSVVDYERAAKIARSAKRKIYFGTPRIVPEPCVGFVKEILRCAEVADAVYAHNIGVLSMAREINRAPFFADWSLVVGNAAAIDFLREYGASGVTLSPELTLAQVVSLVEGSSLPTECIIDGRAEIMVTKFCPIASFLSPQRGDFCGRPCRKGKFFLKDRKGIMFPMWTDEFCRAHIMNSKPLSMMSRICHGDGGANFLPLGKGSLRRLRIDARGTVSSSELKRKIGMYKKAAAGLLADGEADAYERDVTRGHYFRGVE